jgi:type I restriction enzyme S subunit
MDGAIGSTGFHVLRTNSIAPSWLFYLVQTDVFIDAMSRLVQGALYPAVRPKDVRSHTISIAPLGEQHRIVAEIEKHFTRLDASVAALERARGNLKRYRAAVLKAACGGRLVPTEAELVRAEGREYEPADVLLERILKERRAEWEADQLAKMRAAGKEPKDDRWKIKYKDLATPDTTILPELPEGWAWASAAQLSSGVDHSLTIGPFGSDLKVSDYREQGVPLVFVRNIRAKVFGGADTSKVSEDKARELRAHWVSPGDILVTKMGDPPGDACLYPDGQPVAVITADCIKLRPNAELTDSQFLVHAINSHVVRPQILAITKGVAQLKVSLARFKTIVIPLPPLAEQHRIVAEVERRLSLVEEMELVVEHSVKRAERLRQAVLKRAFEGNLVPQDPNDEPASVLLERIRAERAAQAHPHNDRPAPRRSRRAGSPPARRTGAAA